MVGETLNKVEVVIETQTNNNSIKSINEKQKPNTSLLFYITVFDSKYKLYNSETQKVFIETLFNRNELLFKKYTCS